MGSQMKSLGSPMKIRRVSNENLESPMKIWGSPIKVCSIQIMMISSPTPAKWDIIYWSVARTGLHSSGTIVHSRERTELSRTIPLLRNKERTHFLKILEQYWKNERGMYGNCLKRTLKSGTRSKSGTHFKSGTCRGVRGGGKGAQAPLHVPPWEGGASRGGLI